MKNLKIILTLTFIFLIFSGCGKDKDLQDSRNEIYENNLAQLQGISGRYSGLLKRNGVILGGLQVELLAETAVVNPTGSSQTTAQPTLVVQLQFQSAQTNKAGNAPASFSMYIQAANSFYDTTAGIFSADFTLQRQQSVSHTQTNSLATPNVRLSGTLSGGHLVGTLSGIGFEKYGGNFDLVLNGQSLLDLSQNVNEVDDLVFTQKNFSGMTNFNIDGKSSVQKNVNLILFKAETTSEDSFLTMLVPVIPVTATLDYGAAASFNFNASWDVRTGKLTGTTTITNSDANALSVEVSLACDEITVKSKSGFQCSENISNTPGAIASTTVMASKNVSAPIQINTQSASQVQRTYRGEGQFQQGEWTPLQFTATYAARTRMQDIEDLMLPNVQKNLSVSFLTNSASVSSAVSVTFGSALWDPSSGSLNAQQSVTAAGFQAQLSLSCQNFFFNDPKTSYSFNCNYLSTARNFSGTFRLHN